MKQFPTNNFLKLSNQLLQSTKFNFAEKVLLSYVIGWQESGKDCTASNIYISEQLGITIKVLNKLITNLNKYSFFNSSKLTRQNQYGSWVNSKIMYVNIEELNKFISTEEKELIIPSTKVEIPLEVITDARIEDNIKVVVSIPSTEIKEDATLKSIIDSISIDDLKNYFN